MRPSFNVLLCRFNHTTKPFLLEMVIRLKYHPARKKMGAVIIRTKGRYHHCFSSKLREWSKNTEALTRTTRAFHRKRLQFLERIIVQFVIRRVDETRRIKAIIAEYDVKLSIFMICSLFNRPCVIFFSFSRQAHAQH